MERGNGGIFYKKADYAGCVAAPGVFVFLSSFSVRDNCRFFRVDGTLASFLFAGEYSGWPPYLAGVCSDSVVCAYPTFAMDASQDW